MERLIRLPAEESLGYRLDRALLESHLRRELRPPMETRISTSTPAHDPSGVELAARELLEALAANGLAEARPLEPSKSATVAIDAAFLALAERVRPKMPLSPARLHFEAPGFRVAWAKLGAKVVFDLGLAPPGTVRERVHGGGLEAAYEQIREQQDVRFRPWDVARLLLGLGSDDLELVRFALAEMGVIELN